MPPKFKLTNRRIRVNAPRGLVWDMITGIGKGQLPNSENTARLVERKGDNVLVVEFITHSDKKTYTTLEEMTLYRPDRITYRHLTGPLPYVWEEIKLQDAGAGQSQILYKGKFGTKSLLGYILGPLYIRPLFDKLALTHLREIKAAAETLALRSRKHSRRAGGKRAQQAISPVEV